MAHAIRHYRLTFFFLFIIIAVTYFLMYLNHEKVKAANSGEHGHLSGNNDNIIMMPSYRMGDVSTVGSKLLQIMFSGENREGSRPSMEKRIEESSITKRPFPSIQNGARSDESVNAASKLPNESKAIPYHMFHSNALPSDQPQPAREVTPLYDIADNHDISVDDLSQILEKKIQTASSIMKRAKTKPGCVSNKTIANSCDNDKCLRMKISEDAKERISELVAPKQLQLSYSDISTLINMRNKVNGYYDTILLTAASSNHFLESQALIKNLHENIFPHLNNFVLIYYNLGLTPEEREQLVRYCNCTVVDFPFDEVPVFVKNLKCYSWKPIMIKAHIDQGNVVAWMDASMRFQNIMSFKQLIERTRSRGVQMPGPSEKNPFRTVRSMYHFFGEEPCAYLQMGQLFATTGFFKRDPFVIRAILEPWVACALNRKCICPSGIQQRTQANKEMSMKWREEGGPIEYGLMHRYDQSAISLIIHKLFYKYYRYIIFDLRRFHTDIRRNDRANYFQQIATA